MSDPTERRNLEQRVEAMEIRLARGDSRMGSIERSLDANTKATTEVLDIVTMGKGFFRTMGYIGRFIKWISVLSAAVGGGWAAWTHK